MLNLFSKILQKSQRIFVTRRVRKNPPTSHRRNHAFCSLERFEKEVLR